ncbi:MAG: HIT domain-containing protein [Candidatus Berkiella sp.]
MTFVLNSTLEKDSEFIIDLPLSQARLSNNAAFTWIILIPRKENLTEIIDLSIDDQTQLLKEIRQTSIILQKLFKADKLNVANLGNMVSQLHIHLIARFKTDPAWPNPVWNSGVSKAYSLEEKETLLVQLRNQFQEQPC